LTKNISINVDFFLIFKTENTIKETNNWVGLGLGRSRFMQGADTDPNDVAKIREALAAGTTYCGRLLNYKKDGTPFWNLLTIAPIKDEHGKILKLIGCVNNIL
jgi:non-specific serine/threonine protein kinase